MVLVSFRQFKWFINIYSLEAGNMLKIQINQKKSILIRLEFKTQQQQIRISDLLHYNQLRIKELLNYTKTVLS